MGLGAAAGPDLLLLATALVAAGLVAGLIAGLLGVGGGIVVVPALYFALQLLGVDEAVRMHVTVATSLAVIVPTSISSLASHARRDAVDRALLMSWAPAVGCGAVLGAAIAGLMSAPLLTAFFAGVALLVAAQLAFGREQWRLAPAPPGFPVRDLLAGVIGAVSAIMGIGGGTFGVVALTLFGFPIHRAVGTAAGLGLLISIPGAAGFMIAGWGVPGRPPGSLGYVNLIAFACLAPATALAAPLGARLAHSLSRVMLKRVFAAFLALTALRMLTDL